MKKNYFFTLFLTLFLSFGMFAQTTIFINEIHYDNNGGDVDEGVEIAGPSGTDLQGYKIVLYNGTSSQLKQYNTIDLEGVISDQQSGLGTIWFPISGIQNGGPDGIALADSRDNLVQFLSYEGSFTAVDGLAINATSTDIGVEEVGTTPVGESLQLTGSGSTYENFTWSGPITNTNGNPNTGQTFGGTPMASIAILSPDDNQVFTPSTTEVSVKFSIANFTFSGDAGNGTSDNSGDGFVKTSLVVGQTSSDANFFTDSPSPIEVAAGSSYTVTAELVDNVGNSLNPKVEATVSFSIGTSTEVANIAALRAGTEGEFYTLTGEAILTYARESRNQKYIQDESGAILIDDTAGKITTTYNTYEGITGIQGRLDSFRDVLQFVPSADSGAATSTGNKITPEVVSLADFVANFDNYESELIQINDVSFADAGSTFETSTNYNITSGQVTAIFRTNFSEADYIGTTIPSGMNSMVALGAESNGTPQLIAINLAGLVLSTGNFKIEGFSTFPNPVTDGELTVTSKSNDIKSVSVYNVLGKQVFSDAFSGTFKTLNLAGFSSGIYILRVAESGKMATKKLVIK